MSVFIEFEYRPPDSDEANKTIVRHVRRQNPAIKTVLVRRIGGWIVFITLAVILVNRVAQPGSENIGTFIFTWTFAIIAVGILILTAIRQQMRRLRKPLEGAYSMNADDAGLVLTGPKAKTEYKWTAFHGFDETTNLIVIYIDDARLTTTVRAVVIPRRAFGSGEMRAEFSRLLNNNVQARDSALPLVPREVSGK